jgi:hypothetical protein
MKKIALLACFSALSLIAAAAPQYWPYADGKTVALGGEHAALAEGLSVLYTNPAGLAAVSQSFTFSTLNLNLSGPVFDIASLIISSSDTSSIIANVLNLFDDKGRFYSAVDLGGPISIGYVGNGLGFGVFCRSWAEINAASILSININIQEEFSAIGGYGYRFTLLDGNTLDIGASAKGFIKGELPYSTNLLGLTSLVSDFSSVLTESPFDLTLGVGVDAGIRYTLAKRYIFAISAQDAYTPTFKTEYNSLSGFLISPSAAQSGSVAYSLERCNLSAGFCGYIPLGPLDNYISSFKLMVDYNDILSLWDTLQPNPILLASAGMEITIHDILAIRCGINQALFSAGFGLDLSLCKLNIAMYGRELGSEPGARPVYNLLLGVDFSL